MWEIKVEELKHLAIKQGVSNYKIAKDTGLSQSTISRVFSLKFCPTLKVFMLISKSLGAEYELQ